MGSVGLYGMGLIDLYGMGSYYLYGIDSVRPIHMGPIWYGSCEA